MNGDKIVITRGVAAIITPITVRFTFILVACVCAYHQIILYSVILIDYDSIFEQLAIIINYMHLF